MEKTYVLVDDNGFDRSQLKRIILREDARANIIECNCLAALRNYLHVGVADVILLDNNLPDGLGAEYAKEISEDKRLSQIPVIMISDDSPSQLGDVIKRQGQTALLCKDGLTPLHLKETIKGFLKQKNIPMNTKQGDQTLLVLEDFSQKLGREMLTPLSRALRLVRSAKNYGAPHEKIQLKDTLETLETLLLESRDYVATLGGQNSMPEHANGNVEKPQYQHTGN